MSVRSVHSLVNSARREIDHEFRTIGSAPEEYLQGVIFTIENGDMAEVADDWARQQNEYVYTTAHWDMEADFRYTDEWQEAERAAAKMVALHHSGYVVFGGPDSGGRLLEMVKWLRAETVAVFLADVYTTAVWDWLHLIRAESVLVNDYLDEQAELAMAGVRDTPHFD